MWQRGYETLIQEAELMAMAPEAVAEFLKRRGKLSEREAIYEPVDYETEMALRSRNCRLIDLAIARYGRSGSVVGALFKAAAKDDPIRLAALSNSSESRIYHGFPVCFFGANPDSEEVVKWLLSAGLEELRALFENPTLDDKFVAKILERDGEWKDIPDETLQTILSILISNKRLLSLRTPPYGPFAGGYGDGFERVRRTIWRLACTVEPNVEWASWLALAVSKFAAPGSNFSSPGTYWSTGTVMPVAARLDQWSNFRNLAPRSIFDDVDPLTVINRWQPSENAPDHPLDWRESGITQRQTIRYGLAGVALLENPTLLPEFLASDDVALRCAACAVGDISLDDLAAAIKEQGGLVLIEGMCNPRLWKTTKSREALRDFLVSRLNLENFPWGTYTSTSPYDHFEKIEQRIRQLYPPWFRDEVKDDPEDVPATKRDLEALVDLMNGADSPIRKLTEYTRETLRAIKLRLGWVFWLALGALVASMKHL